MKRISAWMTLLLAFGALLTEPLAQDNPRSVVNDQIIEDARRHALAFRSELPNFVVNQKVTCSELSPRTNGEWRVQSTLEIELTNQNVNILDTRPRANLEEMFGERRKVLKVDGKPTKKSYEDLHVMLDFGELSLLMLPFARNAIFKQAVHDNIRGRDTVTYDFRVEKAKSVGECKGWEHLVPKGHLGFPIHCFTYSGRVWIDSETRQVMRVEVASEDMPPKSRVTLEEDAVDYDWVTIEDHKYLLPVHSEALAGFDLEKYYYRNVNEFVNYHKWEGRITILPNKK